MIFEPLTIQEAYTNLQECQYRQTLDDDTLYSGAYDWMDYWEEEVRLKKLIKEWEKTGKFGNESS
jgi:hypothetical protein